MVLDPRVGFWFSVALAALTTLAAFATQYTTLFGAAQSEKILAVLGIANAVGGAVNAVLHTIPAKQSDASKFLLGPKA